MKRNLSIVLAIMLVISMLAGCGGKTEQPKETALKLGMAVLPSISGSAAATAEAEGKANFDVTVVAVLVDDEGIIRDCIIDSVGTSVKFNANGEPVDFDAAKAIQTKNELGEAYGMKAYAGSKYEWNEQADALAKFAVEKNVADLRSGAVNESGKAKDADLASVATIHIGSYVNAIEKAVANAQHLGAKSGDQLKLGVINTMAAAAAGEKDGSIELTLDAAALTMNGETITSCYIDSLQAKVTFNAAGEITNDVTVAPQTKNELGEAYGMKAHAGATFEWNEQAANYASYITNKTVADVAGIALAETTKPADGTDLAATVTIAIGGFQALIAKTVK